MRTYLHSVDSDWFNQRLVGVFVTVLAIFILLAVRLIYLQVIQGKELRRLSEINSIRLQDIDAPRGIISDRNGHILVDNRPAFNLYIILKDAKPLDHTLTKLAGLLAEPVEALRTTIQSSRKKGAYAPILLKEDISRDTLAAVEVHKFELPGVQVHVTSRRHYLYEGHAAHVLGYLGEISSDELQCPPFEDCKGGDYVGKFGIEKAFETALRGKRGGQQVEVNARGQVVRVLETVDAQRGQDIVLTIDQSLQSRAEELLAGQAGSAVAIDPQSGQVLVMASSPAFNANNFVKGLSRDQWNELISNPLRPLENKAIQAEYPPASTYKIVTTIAGLEEGAIDAQSSYFCPGYLSYGNRAYRCWKKGGHGEVHVVRALTESCDVFYYQVGIAVGVDGLAKYAKALGLGAPTGISLDRESKGLIPTSEWKLRRFGVPWQGGETLSVAIGQGFNLVTPLQMAVLAAAVGSGGVRYKPYLVQSARSADGQVVFEQKPEVVANTHFRPETLALTYKGMWGVVNDPRGTAYLMRIKDVPFSGKTGTAQVVSRPKDGEVVDPQSLPKDHAWFVAFAPSVNPTIAVAVMIEHGEHGSSAAAPVAREIIRLHLHLPEDNTTKIIDQKTRERIGGLTEPAAPPTEAGEEE
ncbi:MAG: penicillin-binding protein 2 [Desulfobacteraceae bacterium]|nr:penicillin-binding protein 2 [Desulfobacteraceae bacterium]